jgi:hypothetical protein
MGHRWSRIAAAGALAAVALGVVPMAEAGGGGTPVLAGPKRDIYPAATAGATFLGYSENAAGAPNHFDVYVKPASGAAFKINGRGQGFSGGFDGSTFVWQFLEHGQSDLKRYDASTRRPIAAFSSKVNTRFWEWRPTISGNHLLFSRFDPGAASVTDRILLANTSTGDVVFLDRQQRGKPSRYLTAGQVNGDFAVWDSHVAHTRKLNVRTWTISTSTLHIVPLPAGRVQYSPSVSASGDVFYVRSAAGCGNGVTIHKRAANGTDTRLVSLPQGSDVFKTYAVDEAGSAVTVYYDVYNCATGGLDVYKVTVP